MKSKYPADREVRRTFIGHSNHFFGRSIRLMRTINFYKGRVDGFANQTVSITMIGT